MKEPATEPVETWPCLGTVGTECESLDVDRLPALVGYHSNAPLSAQPCDNCMAVLVYGVPRRNR